MLINKIFVTFGGHVFLEKNGVTNGYQKLLTSLPPKCPCAFCAFEATSHRSL